MMTKNTPNLRRITAGSTRLWTVVTLVDGRIGCTIHPSERHAYREAVVRFEYAESQGTIQSRDLQALLESATNSGDYGKVRKYIEANASQISLLQITEHDIGSFNARDIVAA